MTELPHPGPRRLGVGDARVTALPDGFMRESARILTLFDADAVADLLVGAGLPPEPVVQVNAFLVELDGALVLVDAGCGDAMGPDAGRLASSLAGAGVAPAEIGLVLLTHLHPDHVGGLLSPDGRARFPGARILAPKADAAVFLDPARAAAAPAGAKLAFATARAVADAYGERFETFDGAPRFAPGIDAVPLPGHSPGHTGYRLSSRGASLLIWGDVVHVPAVQFPRPEVGVVFDADAALARQTRHDAFAAAARSGEPVAGMHMPVPGWATVLPGGNGAAFRMGTVA